MMYLIRCEHPQGIEVTTLGIKLKKGDAFECPKHIYDTNRELKSLLSAGLLSYHPKLPVVHEAKKKGLVAHARPPRPTPQTNQVVHKTEVHHHENQVDLDDLASKLLEKLSGVFSPEMLAQAIASQLPQTQQIVVSQPTLSQPTLQQPPLQSSSEELTFIPSKIISSDLKSSTKSTVAETSGADEGLSDALSALRAMRKAKKD